MKISKNQFAVFCKGFAMGMADIVPGVSGGTVALITGIYDRLIESISLVNKEFLKYIFRFQFKEGLRHINIDFVLPLGLGILMAIVSMAKIMHYFMEHYSIYTWSLFFGLILASIYFVGKQVPALLSAKNLFFVAIGTLSGYLVVSLIPVQTPETSVMIFFSGAIAICAMILPGISGSFILLILGKYLFVTSAVKAPFVTGNMQIIFIFALGCLVGLLSFSKILNYLLKHHHEYMMCVLVGFMIGSMKKIWPWREVLEQQIIRGKVHVLRDAVILPKSFSMEEIFALLIMILGVVLVFTIESKVNDSRR